MCVHGAICNRGDLPVQGKDAMSEGYRTYLGLCSHEYFHTWNVKRIKPAAFRTVRFERRELHVAAVAV
ncbi:MAG: Putative protease [uncultured Paraburkholderia sp.]|nr:MAG: Putative protease [uncultured Paraburkholderia sp.]CAH2945074.1 MAG: Putative protease [uncultured Paraburkholderia sp.]